MVNLNNKNNAINRFETGKSKKRKCPKNAFASYGTLSQPLLNLKNQKLMKQNLLYKLEFF